MYASKHMMPTVLNELSKATQEEVHGIDIHSKHGHASMKAEGVRQRMVNTFAPHLTARSCLYPQAELVYELTRHCLLRHLIHHM